MIWVICAFFFAEFVCCFDAMAVLLSLLVLAQWGIAASLEAGGVGEFEHRGQPAASKR